MSNTLVIKPGYRDEFLRELGMVLPEARQLEACLLLEVGEVVGRPGTFVLFERWRNGKEYVDEVLQLPFFRRYLERSERFYAGPRSVLALTPVS